MQCVRREHGGQLGKTPHAELLKKLGGVSLDWRSLEETSHLDPAWPRTGTERGRCFFVDAQDIVR